jgi:hypothetical protein
MGRQIQNYRSLLLGHHEVHELAEFQVELFQNSPTWQEASISTLPYGCCDIPAVN